MKFTLHTFLVWFNNIGGSMAKRFTDTTKWEREWFTDLSNNEKLIWFYLCDQCDHAGIWHINYKLISFHLNIAVTQTTFEVFGGRVKILGDKLLLTGFVDFQYGDKLNPKSKIHASVIGKLEKVNPLISLSIPLDNPSHTLSSHLYETSNPLIRVKDKEKDMDKDKEKEKDKEREERLKLVAEYNVQLTNKV